MSRNQCATEPSFASAPCQIGQLLEVVENQGWALVSCTSDRVQFLSIASRLGKLVQTHASSYITTLAPFDSGSARPNTASSLYGLDQFPMHTDFAHWPNPPRFLLFRSVGETSSIPTCILDSRRLNLDSNLGLDLKRAVWRVTRVSRQFLCSASIAHSGKHYLRWDPSVMVPYGDVATKIQPKLKHLLNEVGNCYSETILWKNNQQVLILDNWRMLHSRPAVPLQHVGRRLERIAVMGSLDGKQHTSITLDA